MIALAMFVMSCTVRWVEYDGSVHRQHVPWLAFESGVAAQTAVIAQNAAHNRDANKCDYRRVELQTSDFGLPTEGGIAIVVTRDTAAAWLNALILALGIVPPALPCSPDSQADVRGVTPANPPCPQ